MSWFDGNFICELSYVNGNTSLTFNVNKQQPEAHLE